MNDTERYLGELPTRAKRSLGQALGLASVTASAVQRAVARPEGVAALLGDADAESIATLLDWVLCTQHFNGGTVQSRWGEDAPTPDRVDAWAARGVVARRYGWVVVLPPLVAALRGRAAARQLGRVRTGELPPPAFAAAMILALYAQDSPRITRSGDVHGTWGSRLAKRWGQDGLWLYRREFLEVFLRQTGALIAREDGAQNRRLEPNVSRLGAAFGASPRATALAFLQGVRSYGLEINCLAVLSRARAKSPTGVTFERLYEDLTGAEGRARYRCQPGSVQAVVEGLVCLSICGLLRIEGSRDAPVLTLSDPPAAGDTRWIVQPSFEVLVPWDVAPLRVACLATVAELESVDRVCRFRLTPASVARGVAGFASPQALLRLLEEGSSVPLSANVRTTLEGWMERTRPFRSHRGDVVFAVDEDQRALVRKVAPGAVEVVPGAFCLPPERAVAVLAAARKAGMPVMAAAPVLEDPSSEDAASMARKLEMSLRELVEAPAKARGRQTTARFWRDTETEEDGEEEDDDIDEDDGEDDPLDRVLRDSLERASSAAGRSSPRAAPAAPREATWQSVLPGRLREILEAAIEVDDDVDVLYVNSKNESSERCLKPIRIHDTNGRAFLVAFDRGAGSENRLALDRITAVRT